MAVFILRKPIGNALAWFTTNYSEKGPTWSCKKYKYPNIQHAGNLWYHDHALGLTQVNFLAGLIAPYVIRDTALDEALNLSSEPEFDRHLMASDHSFYTDGSLNINSKGNNQTIHPQWQPEYFGDVIIMNGKAWPYLNVPPRKYWFRIINRSNTRYFQFSLTNRFFFVVVGSDLSYLPSSVTATNITLSPAEIADVLVDFLLTTANESVLINDAKYPYPDSNVTDELNSKIMKFVIIPGAPIVADTSNVPSTIKSYNTNMLAGAATTTRYIALQEYQSPARKPMHLYIKGLKFTDPVETPVSGSMEVWEVIN